MDARRLGLSAVVAALAGFALLAAGLFWLGAVVLLTGLAAAAFWLVEVSGDAQTGRHSALSRKRSDAGRLGT